MPGCDDCSSTPATRKRNGRAERWSIETDIQRVDPGTPDTSRLVADRDELERGFQRLEPDQRILLVLHYHVGLPLQETADALGLPLGTVKSRLFRATQATSRAVSTQTHGPG